jgi:hypothetical protein
MAVGDVSSLHTHPQTQRILNFGTRVREKVMGQVMKYFYFDSIMRILGLYREGGKERMNSVL